jgi:hypothetical protein
VLIIVSIKGVIDILSSLDTEKGILKSDGSEGWETSILNWHTYQRMLTPTSPEYLSIEALEVRSMLKGGKEGELSTFVRFSVGIDYKDSAVANLPISLPGH